MRRAGKRHNKERKAEYNGARFMRPSRARCARNWEMRLDCASSPREAFSIDFSPTKVNMAGIKLKLNIRSKTVPKATRPPKILTGTMSMNSSTEKPAAVASAV